LGALDAILLPQLCPLGCIITVVQAAATGEDTAGDALALAALPSDPLHVTEVYQGTEAWREKTHSQT